MTHLAIMPQPVVEFAHDLLRFFHDSFGLSWGLSIIALTVAVRLVILPLTFKGVRGMQELQRHGPELKKIQERYKEDTQRRNEETMKYYKEHGVNPLSSCLPLLLQIPVFITLFDLLNSMSNTCQPGGAPPDPICGDGFLGIENLAAASPFPGLELFALMALYIGTQLGASLVSMANAEGMQKRLILFLPVVFVPFIITFPTGLVVYWITTNLWTVLQQLAVKKLLPTPAPAATTEATDAEATKGAGKVPASGNGAGSSAPRKTRPKAPAANGSNGGTAKAPPPSPRKKKKRSGRRR